MFMVGSRCGNDQGDILYSLYGWEDGDTIVPPDTGTDNK
jgi:hypothetical protein